MPTITGGRAVGSTYPPRGAPRFPTGNPDSPNGLSQAELARAIPSGSRCVRRQREALRAGLGCPELAGVRADFRGHLTDWWRLHVLSASWGGEGRPPRGTTQPTRARVCERAGMSVSTYKACRRWWEARGYVAIVRPGWTPLLRPGALLGPDDRNERQVLVLCVPRKRSAPPTSAGQTLTRPLTKSRRDLDRFPARVSGPPEPRSSPPGCDRPSSWPLRGLTEGWWAHLTGPFTAAGWTPGDLTWAVDHDPRGRQHRHRLSSVRHPAGWLRWRLARWLDPDGKPLPSRSQQAGAYRTRVLAEQAERRASAERARSRAAGVDVAAHAAELRGILAAVRLRQTSAAARAGRPTQGPSG